MLQKKAQKRPIPASLARKFRTFKKTPYTDLITQLIYPQAKSCCRCLTNQSGDF